MDNLLSEVRSCQICSHSLPLGPRPVVSVHQNSRILIIGQAPGTKVHQSGIPWIDASGKNLRSWLGVTENQFYDPKLFAIMPMGFCYPGKGKSGDLTPRPECAPFWHDKLLNEMPQIQLILLIGQYAQNYYLSSKKDTLTETVRAYREYLPTYFPLVHSSPRNGIWMKKNPWFEDEIIPALKEKVRALI